jgi:hypothetical protein
MEGRGKMKRYAYGNGMPGCLLDYHSGFCYETEAEAIEAAADALELTEEETAQLGEYSPLYVHGERFHEIGAGVVEIFSDEIAITCENCANKCKGILENAGACNNFELKEAIE